MIAASDVHGILFDAGDTLVGPTSGHWYIPPNFERISCEFGVKMETGEFICEHLPAGLEFLSENHTVTSVEHEHRQFVEFFEICFHIG